MYSHKATVIFFIEWVKNKKDGTPYKRISLMNSIEVDEIEKA